MGIFMKDKNIKYIIAITPFTNSYNIKTYTSPYGKVWIVSRNDGEYVLNSAKLYNCTRMMFYDTRKFARCNKIMGIYNEFIIKVRVENDKIVEWIKKNP